MSNKEAYNLLNSKLAFSASNYEHIQAFEIPVSKVYKIRRGFSASYDPQYTTKL